MTNLTKAQLRTLITLVDREIQYGETFDLEDSKIEESLNYLHRLKRQLQDLQDKEV